MKPRLSRIRRSGGLWRCGRLGLLAVGADRHAPNDLLDIKRSLELSPALVDALLAGTANSKPPQTQTDPAKRGGPASASF